MSGPNKVKVNPSLGNNLTVYCHSMFICKKKKVKKKLKKYMRKY